MDLQEKDFNAIAKQARKETFSLYAVPRLMSKTQCKEILTAIAEGAKTN